MQIPASRSTGHSLTWQCARHQDAYREAVQELQRRERGGLTGASSRMLADIEVRVASGSAALLS
jgi:hypothetical protein